MNFQIDGMKRSDWRQVRAIYGQGLATSLAAFMLTPPRWAAWHAAHLSLGRFVARDGAGVILGWSALAPVPDN